jgi:hypothetical protein
LLSQSEVFQSQLGGGFELWGEGAERGKQVLLRRPEE